MQVAIGGQVKTSSGPGKTVDLELSASASYRFRERRLPGAGRDAAALRSLREFDEARVDTKIGDRSTSLTLPAAMRRIVAQGRREGVLRYSPDVLLTREALDLLETPGDPTAVLALLPARAIELEERYDVPEWAVEMLAAVDAATKAKMTGKLVSVSDEKARIQLNGTLDGARLGASTRITLSGELVFDLTQKLVVELDLTYEEQSAIGTVAPGVDSQVRVVFERMVVPEVGNLTDEALDAVPLEPPADRLALAFVAAPWGLRLAHSRGWHVFHASFDQDPQVAILRLVDQGNLICQCNFAPIATVAAGEHTPLEDYEDSIRRSLGSGFGAIVARERIPAEDGRSIFRVTTEGKYVLSGGEATQPIPMNWIYYLCTHPSGRQVSFVFAVEPGVRERLAGQDVQIVQSLQFE
jgi:hypothetical protein